MTPRIKKLRKYLLEWDGMAERRTVEWKKVLPRRRKPTRCMQAADFLQMALAEEAKTPRFLLDERIACLRACANPPLSYSPEVRSRLREEAYYHALSVPVFARVLADGLEARRKEAVLRRKRAVTEKDSGTIDFLDAVIRGIDAVLALADAYRDAALAEGRSEIAETLSQVPRHPARNFLEALQFLRILYFALNSKCAYCGGIGRFDQYLFPYLEADLRSKTLTERTALELLEEFFLTFVRDGVPMTLVLGGKKSDGADGENLLTQLCRKAAEELDLDSFQVVNRGSRSPRGSDDAVIAAMERFGYAPEDARNYTETPGGEILVPGQELNLVDVITFSLSNWTREVIASAEASVTDSFASFQHLIRCGLFSEADQIAASLDQVEILPCPMISMLSGQIDRGRDLGECGKYHNFGICALDFVKAATLLDQVRQQVFVEKRYSMAEYVDALRQNPAMADDELPGDGTPPASWNDVAIRLLEDFAKSWENRVNCHGGIYRPTLELDATWKAYLTKILPPDDKALFLAVF